MSVRYALIAATPALAQTQYADSSGTFLAFNGLGLQPGIEIDATAGQRLGRGFDAGFRVGYRQYESAFSDQYGFTAGPVVGLTKALGSGFSGRVEGAFLHTSYRGDFSTRSNFSSERFARQALVQDLTATISHPVRVVGSLRLRPTVGLYATATQSLSVERPAQYGSLSRGPWLQEGVHLELPLTFRLFGQDAAIAPVFRINLGYDNLGTSAPYSGGGLRLNF